MGLSKRIKLLAAGIVRDLEFASMADLNLYLARLDGRKICYEVLETFERDDRSVIIRIGQQYNDSKMIQLYV